MPLPHRGLVLCNAHVCTDLPWSQSYRGLNRLDEKSAFRPCCRGLTEFLKSTGWALRVKLT